MISSLHHLCVGQAQLIKVRYDPLSMSTYDPLDGTVQAVGESQGMSDVINVDTCVVRLVRGEMHRSREKESEGERE